MSNPYVGEIRMFAGNFAPVGWAFCDGTILSIAQNTTLFQLIGTTYGGDGVNTFVLPDLRSRVPVHMGAGFTLGQANGEEQVTLTVGQIPAHTHVPQANSTTGMRTTPAGNVWASSSNFPYSASAPGAAMAPQAISSFGGSLPHDNMIPFLAVNFIISMFGIFPSQT
jgi:microcystin-dependent protein